MKVLLLEGRRTGVADDVKRGWVSAAASDRVRLLRVPESVPEAIDSFGLLDICSSDEDAALDALGRGREIALGARDAHDAGHGLLTAASVRFGELEAARDAVAGTRVWADDPIPLRGLRGAGARRAETVGHEIALRDDQRLGQYADSIERALSRRDLMEDRPVRWSREPYSGAGGGMGFALLALGGVIEHVRTGASRLLGINDHIANSDIVVLVMESFGVEELAGSIATVAATPAINAAVPVIAVVENDHTSRRQRADLGITGTYSYHGELNNVSALAHRIARTWSVSI